jgi:nucleoside-diphosphate-sugar epimerase
MRNILITGGAGFIGINTAKYYLKKSPRYVRDYARIYDLNTIVFRQSCIYGPNQFGVEDQGWIAMIFPLPRPEIVSLNNGEIEAVPLGGKKY